LTNNYQRRTRPVIINVMCRALPSVGGFSEIRDLRSDGVADLQPSTLGMPHRASVTDVNTRN